MTATQIRQTLASHVFGATVSTTNLSPNLVDSANGFVASDVGRAVTTAATTGRTIASVTNPGLAVMDGNATATGGPQVLTLASVLTNVTKTSGTATTAKATPFLAALPTGQRTQAMAAINRWINAAGVGTHAAAAAKILAAQGLFIQET